MEFFACVHEMHEFVTDFPTCAVLSCLGATSKYNNIVFHSAGGGQGGQGQLCISSVSCEYCFAEPGIHHGNEDSRGNEI